MNQDHVNAMHLAAGLRGVPGIKVMSPSSGGGGNWLCWTNMVIFETEEGTISGEKSSFFGGKSTPASCVPAHNLWPHSSTSDTWIQTPHPRSFRPVREGRRRWGPDVALR